MRGRVWTTNTAAPALARLRLDAGDEWAIAWVPRIQAADRDQVSQIQYFLTSKADAALPDLLSAAEERRTKLWIADWNALDVPRPHGNGSHLAITVPLPTT
jgi:hypothetical protein